MNEKPITIQQLALAARVAGDTCTRCGHVFEVGETATARVRADGKPGSEEFLCSKCESAHRLVELGRE